LTIARDRLLGILLGTVVSAIVFRFVWTEHAADALRTTLARVLRTVAQLLHMPKTRVPMTNDGKAAVALHNSLSKDLDSVLVLSEQATVENVMFRTAKSFDPVLLEHFTAHIQAMCLITTALLRRTKLEEWERLGEPVQVAETALRGTIADHLDRAAVFVEHGQRPEECHIESALAAWNEQAAHVTGNDRPRLVRRLVEQVRTLTEPI
jgi:hypothetical protein